VSYESLGTLASVGTFIVITATAVAAMIQLGHLRSSNQLQAVTAFARDFDTVTPHLAFVYNDLPAKMEDPTFRREIGRVVNPDQHPELLVAVFLDRCGMLIRLRLMDERFVLEHGTGATAILQCWHNLEGVIAIRRRHAPDAYRNFEHLAIHAKAWLVRHPHGTFSATEPRLPVTDRWAADEASAD
jgi:hypothetical protein